MPLNPPQDYRKTAFTHRIGLAADRPAAADVLPGTLYFSTDTELLERSDGTTWDDYSPLPDGFYEEGTWTPSLVSAGGGTPTYTTQSGSYTKVGRWVTVNFFIFLSGLGTLAAGNLSINGLPFTANAENGIPFVCIFANLGVNYIYVYSVVNPSTTSVILRAQAAAAAANVTNLALADITATFIIAGGITYTT